MAARVESSETRLWQPTAGFSHSKLAPFANRHARILSIHSPGVADRFCAGVRKLAVAVAVERLCTLNSLSPYSKAGWTPRRRLLVPVLLTLLLMARPLLSILRTLVRS